MIQSFACNDTHALFVTRKSRRWSGCCPVALRKLDQIEAAGRLEDLRILPGNRLEALDRDRAGQHSIRVNGQWRIVVVWQDGGPHDVAIVDYH